MPAISIVMPLYNREDSVARAISSVLAQDFRDFELIVVDDHSSDDGPRIVESFADDRVRLLRLPRRSGANAARNRGIEQAGAAIVAFLDSDDEYQPNRLSRVAETFSARPELGGMLDGYRRPSKRPDRPDRMRWNPATDDPDALLAQLFQRRIYKATSGIAVRREVAIRCGLFDEALPRRQDYDFLIRMIRAAPFLSTGEVTWIKHRGRDAISDDHTKYLPAFIAFWDRHPDYYDNRDFRRGFNLDLARHTFRLGLSGQWATMRSDLAAVIARLGLARTARSVGSGYVELIRWRSEKPVRTRQTPSV